MNLDAAQKQKVSAWLGEGLKVSDIQKRLASELGVNLTYMEVRFLLDDLKLKPKDIEPPKEPTPSPAPPPMDEAAPASPPGASPEQPAAAGKVSVSVDQIARPGAIVSGKVTFSDGQSAEWYLDQTGRLGVVPKQQGYKPPQADLVVFQNELQNELAKMGF